MSKITKFEARNHQVHQGEWFWCVFCICEEDEMMIGMAGTEENANKVADWLTSRLSVSMRMALMSGADLAVDVVKRSSS